METCNSPDGSFHAYPCKQYKDFKAGLCTNCSASGCQVAGYDSVPTGGKILGRQYFHTGEEFPYFSKWYILHFSLLLGSRCGLYSRYYLTDRSTRLLGTISRSVSQFLRPSQSPQSSLIPFNHKNITIILISNTFLSIFIFIILIPLSFLLTPTIFSQNRQHHHQQLQQNYNGNYRHDFGIDQ